VEKIRLDIIGLSSSESHAGHFALILSEKSGNRRLPIIIGGPEAQAIALEVENIKPNRPMTHDLMFNICLNFDIHLQEVIITELKEGVFYAKLIIDHNDTIHEIDSRPSDAIALAVRFRVAIYTSEKIMQEAGIAFTDEDLEAEREAEKEDFEEISAENLAERISTLSAELEDLLKNEEYEQAAKLRDTINKLQGKK
jgi:bifunctional DNase/RNase